MSEPMDESVRRRLRRRIVGWYDTHARDLPWRRPGVGGWAVLVSEAMLQQTPVARVLPSYERWLDRWPRPADLAAEPAGEAIRAWDRLGYPRRALRLHAAARAITAEHGGEVPSDHDALLALPGVGSYTAAAVAAFAYAGRHTVLDTNVRRVLGRVLLGRAVPPSAVTVDERRMAESLLPRDGTAAARWSVAVMELGALVCTARSPRCDDCPVARDCRWLALGRPAPDSPVRRQAWEGTDRQARGRMMAVLRGSTDPVVPREDVLAVWPRDPAQAERALAGLLADGLVAERNGAGISLPD